MGQPKRQNFKFLQATHLFPYLKTLFISQKISLWLRISGMTGMVEVKIKSVEIKTAAHVTVVLQVHVLLHYFLQFSIVVFFSFQVIFAQTNYWPRLQPKQGICFFFKLHHVFSYPTLLNAIIIKQCKVPCKRIYRIYILHMASFSQQRFANKAWEGCV